MVTYEYKGQVEEIGETKEFGTNGFKRRDLIVGNDVDSMNKYPNPVLFTFKKDRCTLLDTVKKGDRVSVQFSIDGRRWDGPNGTKYFTDLTGWKISVLNVEGAPAESIPQPASPESVEAPAGGSDPDDLPF